MVFLNASGEQVKMTREPIRRRFEFGGGVVLTGGDLGSDTGDKVASDLDRIAGAGGDGVGRASQISLDHRLAPCALARLFRRTWTARAVGVH